MKRHVSIGNFLLFFSIVTVNVCITSCEKIADPINEDSPSEEIVDSTTVLGGGFNYYITMGNVNYYPVVDSCFEYTIPVPSEAELDKLVSSFSSNIGEVFVNGVKQISGETVNDFSNG